MGEESVVRESDGMSEVDLAGQNLDKRTYRVRKVGGRWMMSAYK